jgi:hypothetical protein
MLEERKWQAKWHEAVRLYGLLNEAALFVEVGQYDAAGNTLYEALTLLWSKELREIGDWEGIKQVKQLVERAYTEVDYAGQRKVLSTLNEAMRALRRVRKVLAELAQQGGEI